MSLGLRVQPQHMWSSGFGRGWEVQISQQRETIKSGSTTRVRASRRPMGGWLKEPRPDNWSSHSPGPWQRALSHRTPVKPGEQWHRWWWWHVPPFWQRSIALSHTRAVETEQKGQGRQGGVINRSLRDRTAENINRQVHGAQAASSCPVCMSFEHSWHIREGETKDFCVGVRRRRGDR